MQIRDGRKADDHLVGLEVWVYSPRFGAWGLGGGGPFAPGTFRCNLCKYHGGWKAENLEFQKASVIAVAQGLVNVAGMNSITEYNSKKHWSILALKLHLQELCQAAHMPRRVPLSD